MFQGLNDDDETDQDEPPNMQDIHKVQVPPPPTIAEVAERPNRAKTGKKAKPQCKPAIKAPICSPGCKCKESEQEGTKENVLKMFGQLRSQALAPVSTNEGWERIRSIMDSGASVTVASPDCAAAYEVTEGAAAKAGTMYEIADGTSIPNLGEKTIAVMNCNGTVTAKTQQVAAVSNHLTSVRQEMKGNKIVIFDEEGCFSFNKLTGEVVPIEDNGMNFIMEEWVVPLNELSDVLKAMRDPSFQWQA